MWLVKLAFALFLAGSVMFVAAGGKNWLYTLGWWTISASLVLFIATLLFLAIYLMIVPHRNDRQMRENAAAEVAEKSVGKIIGL